MNTFYTPKTATAVIVANMIGTGVFTSLGFQLVDIQAGFPVLMLWIFGGVAALCGAATYAELGASLPRSGGEYNFLSRIYHPAVGFISGWISATIGFAAPIAAVAIAFGLYAIQIVPGLDAAWAKPLAVTLVIIVTLAHARNRESSGNFQLVFTALKVVLILVFCVAALWMVPDPQPVRILPVIADAQTMLSPAFGVALIYVTYSYMGWNAATYISGELEYPQRDLPKILLMGTALVIAVYVLLNFVFLKVAPISSMTGKVEVGYIAADAAFGDIGGRFIGGLLALLLISTVSAMTLAGPRALQMIGEDFKAMSWFAKTRADGVPHIAIIFQSGFAIFLILTSSFKAIIIFAGAMLAFNNFLAVLGIFVLRYREPSLERPYKTWGYPVTPLIFLAITGFTLIYVVMDNPVSALFGVAVILSGLLLYAVTVRSGPRVPSASDKAQ